VELRLSDLEIGDKGEIISVKSQGEIRRRILDMGLVKGTRFKVLRQAPLGDPIEIFVKGFHLTLRKKEAAGVFVEKIGHVGDGKRVCGRNRSGGKGHWFGRRKNDR